MDNFRKWFSLFVSIILYYIVHEGAHVLVAFSFGAFERIKLLGVGMQVVVRSGFSDIFYILFCVSGVVFTLLFGYLLVLFARRICFFKSKFFRSICFYSTIVFLFLDPLYLSILYRFFGGGDMNGLLLIGVNEFVLCFVFGLIFVLNIFVFVKFVYPLYKESFSN